MSNLPKKFYGVLTQGFGSVNVHLVSEDQEEVELKYDSILEKNGDPHIFEGSFLSRRPKKYKWVVVLDDSMCTVGVGGKGYLWEAYQSTLENCYELKGTETPYYKSIFRDATSEEIDNWLSNKCRAKV